MKSKIIKSMLVPVLGISTVAAATPMVTSCGEKKAEPPKEEIIRVQSVKLNKTSLKLNEGQTEQLTATVLPETATNKKVTWESSKPEIATVDQNGLVTALKEGDTDIIVITGNGERTATCKVVVKHVEIPVTSVELNDHNIDLNEGDFQQLTATIFPANATNKNVTWKSSNPSVATIDSDGTIHALKEGITTITVVTNDGSKTDKCEVTVKTPIIPIERIDLESALELVEGQTQQLTATITPKEATNNVIWTSSNETVATVDQNGLVTALKAGTAIITATANDSSGIKAKCTVTIKAPIVLVKSIELESTLALAEGETDQLTAKVLPEEATNKQVTWSSSNEEVATIDENGKVTALKEGFATIIASAEDGSGIEAKCTVTVSPITVYATGIELSATSFELVEGKTQQLTATISPENVTNKNVIWSSSNEEIVIVDLETGLVKAVAPGEAVIKATAADGSGITVECKVTVKAQIFAVEGVTLDPTETTLVINQTEQLTPIFIPQNATNKNVTWSSSNPEVATVDENGKVTAIAQGEAIITVTTEDGNKTAECKVFVTTQAVAVGKVILDKTTLKLDVNQKEQLTPIFIPEDATNKNVTWKSNNETVATVDENGKIIAIAEGEATITVTTEDGNKTAECMVVVKAQTVAVEKVVLDKSEIQLFTYDNYQLTATVLPKTAKNKQVIWTSSNEDIAIVDENGLLETGSIGGTTTITATSAENKEIKATCEVTVKPYPAEKIELNKETLKLKVGDSEQLTATVLPEYADNKKVTWSSSNPEVATVDLETGLVKALTPGYTTITAITMNGVKASVNVVSTNVLLNYSAMLLFPQESRQLTATVLPSNAERSIRWQSSNSDVATVDTNGKVTSKKEGTVTITAITEDGSKAASCLVNVVVQPTGLVRVNDISLYKSGLILHTGENSQLNATVFPEKATYKTIQWTSSNPNVVWVDPFTGIVVAIAPGEATITATTWDGGFKATCKVVVINKN